MIIAYLETHRVALNNYRSSKKSSLIDLIHINICSVQSKSLGCAFYFIPFIDSHSRKVWVFNIKSKDRVLDVSTKFHTRVERER